MTPDVYATYMWQMFFTIGGADYTIAYRKGYGETTAEASGQAWQRVLHTYPIPEQWRIQVVGDRISKWDDMKQEYVMLMEHGRTMRRGE